jgi:hypothetical protein
MFSCSGIFVACAWMIAALGRMSGIPCCIQGRWISTYCCCYNQVLQLFQVLTQVSTISRQIYTTKLILLQIFVKIQALLNALLLLFYHSSGIFPLSSWNLLRRIFRPTKSLLFLLIMNSCLHIPDQTKKFKKTICRFKPII